MDNRYLPFQTYTQQNYLDWLANLNNLPRQIDEVNAKITSIYKLIQTEQKDLSDFTLEHYNPIKAIIHDLELRLLVLNYHTKHEELSKAEASAKDDLKKVKCRVETCNTNINNVDEEINNLTQRIRCLEIPEELAKLKISQDLLSNQLSQLKQQQIESQNELDKINTEIQRLSEELAALHLKKTERHVNVPHHQAITEESSSSNAQNNNGFTSSNQNNTGFSSSQQTNSGFSSSQQTNTGFSSSQQTNPGSSSTQQNNDDDLEKRIRQIHADRDNLTSRKNKIDIRSNEIKIAGKQLEFDRLERTISELKNEKASLDNKFNGHQSSSSLSSLQDDLRSKRDQLHSYNKTRIELVSEEKSLKHTADKLSRDISDLEQAYKEASANKNQFDDINDIIKLEGELEENRKTFNKLDSILHSRKKEINSQEKTLQQTQNDLSSLTDFYTRQLGIEFYNSLSNPCSFIDNFLVKATHQVENFEKEHPAKQSINTRIYLASLQEKLNFIANEKVETDNESDRELNRNFNRNIVWEMAGYLYDIMNKLTDEDDEFKQLLIQLLQEIPINKDEALRSYSFFAEQAYLQLQPMTEFELRNMEDESYNKALKAFQENIKGKSNQAPEIDELCSKANDLIAAIDHQKLKDTKHKSCDLKYYTRILTKGTALLNNHNNQELQDEFKALILHNDKGKPSLTDKIIGVGLAFVGSILMVASMTAKVFSLGLTTPLSWAGTGAGMLLIASGLGLFKHGMQKSPDRQMHDYLDTAKNTPKFSA